MRRLGILLFLLLLTVQPAAADCVNKFFVRTQGPRQMVTLLTGHLTFQEAQVLSAAIRDGSAPPLEWVSEEGRALAKQFGELKVVRPMPVSCAGKASGVIMIVTFATGNKPVRKMSVRFDPKTIVAFEEQAN